MCTGACVILRPAGVHSQLQPAGVRVHPRGGVWRGGIRRRKRSGGFVQRPTGCEDFGHHIQRKTPNTTQKYRPRLGCLFRIACVLHISSFSFGSFLLLSSHRFYFPSSLVVTQIREITKQALLSPPYFGMRYLFIARRLQPFSFLVDSHPANFGIMVPWFPIIFFSCKN